MHAAIQCMPGPRYSCLLPPVINWLYIIYHQSITFFSCIAQTDWTRKWAYAYLPNNVGSWRNLIWGTHQASGTMHQAWLSSDSTFLTATYKKMTTVDCWPLASLYVASIHVTSYTTSFVWLNIYFCLCANHCFERHCWRSNSIVCLVLGRAQKIHLLLASAKLYSDHNVCCIVFICFLQ